MAIPLQALDIVSGPAFIPATNAPLAGVLELTTDEPARVSVSAAHGTEAWQRDFYEYSTSHAIPLLGFKPDRAYTITVTLHDRQGSSRPVAEPITFVTPRLPADFPPITLLEHKPGKMEPGYTLFRPRIDNTGKFYVVIVDHAAEVVWYTGIPSNYDVRQLANGNLLFPFPTHFAEVNMLGETVQTWDLPEEWTYHHEAFPTLHGTFLYLSTETRYVENFPTSATDPDAPRATTLVHDAPVIELSRATGEMLNRWSPIDMIDPTHIGYLSLLGLRPNIGHDWSHSNAVIEDPRDGSIIVSSRHLNTVIKFSREGRLHWILGPHANWAPEYRPFLLTPVGTPFEWQYAQHAPMVTPQGTLLLFDNGNYRASPPDPWVSDANNYSRAVEYRIHEETMEVSQVWEYGGAIPERLYTPSRGDADWLYVRGNVLITFADISYIGGARPSPYSQNARMARIVEVTHDSVPEVVFDMALFDFRNPSRDYRGISCYRAQRIADLYPLSVHLVPMHPGGNVMTLEWHAVAGHVYAISTSADLGSWEPVDLLTATSDHLSAEVELTESSRFLRVERVHGP